MVATNSLDLPGRLFWSSDQQPGIVRRRAGSGFSYRTADGQAVDDDTRERIRRLAIPPAWSDVWISPSPNGHLQATGRDARGRKQYRYHAQYRMQRDAAKFDKLIEFGHALVPIRKQVDVDLKRPGSAKPKVTALVVRLLEETLVRVGNEEYARENDSYGLTTLRDRHARFGPDGLRLVFTAKSGVRNDVAVHDRRLRNLVRGCQELPGQVLFQYLDDADETRPLTSTDVNDYLRAITGEDVTAKDIRTWKGTVLAAVELSVLPPPKSERVARSAIKGVAEVVAGHLRNTATVARASYIHPALFDAYRTGDFGELWANASGRGSARLSVDERRLLHLLPDLEKRRAA